MVQLAHMHVVVIGPFQYTRTPGYDIAGRCYFTSFVFMIESVLDRAILLIELYILLDNIITKMVYLYYTRQ